MKKSTILLLVKLCFCMCTIAIILATSMFFYFKPSPQTVRTLDQVHLQVPLRIYSNQGQLIAEFGEKRRIPIAFDKTPANLANAFLSAEDSQFYTHHGVDIKGILRAVMQLLSTGHIVSGGSTITMQVARNFFLTNERSFTRKAKEILLAIEIERIFSKQKIFELYLNKIYLGNRAYGVGAAAQVYYGKNIDQLTLAQMAMIAGLPKAPSLYNPIANPTRALARRNWILHRMLELNFIQQSQYKLAITQPVTASYHELKLEVEAPYAAEMVRQIMLDRYGDNAYTDGYQVYTTLSGTMQNNALKSVRNGLIAYDQRHGFRGAKTHLSGTWPKAQKQWENTLENTATLGTLKPAIVTSIDHNNASILLSDQQQGSIAWQDMKWAAPYINVNKLGPRPTRATQIMKVGDLIYVQAIANDRYRLSQVPRLQGALVALNPIDGSIQSLVGGFDFQHSKFNRATQAARQIGSLFKPFLYSAALQNNFTAASIINDAPVVFQDKALDKVWRPRNDNRRFSGPVRLRVALYSSINLASIRLLQAVGIPTAIDYIKNTFGFDENAFPRDLSMALGTLSTTPLKVARAFAIIANGGYEITPYLIARIDQSGTTIFQANSARATKGSPKPNDKINTSSTFNAPPTMPAKQLMDTRVNYIIQSILRDVVKHGTARRALTLKRHDLAGKTGTTNEQKDLWFSGFTHGLVATVWTGFDHPQPLGRREYGSNTPLPIWMDFMKQALVNTPEILPREPAGLVSERIDPSTGQAVAQGGIFEIFRSEMAPKLKPHHDATLSPDDIF